MFSARFMPASEAYDMGLINFIHERDVIESACIDYAKTIASNAPLTVKTAKAAINAWERGSRAGEVAAVRAMVDACFNSEDYQRGARRLRANERPNSKPLIGRRASAFNPHLLTLPFAQEKNAMNPAVTTYVIVIGNEILSGRTQDINVSHIATLGDWGIQVHHARVIPDDETIIVNTVNEVRAAYDYVFTTGGIGPPTTTLQQYASPRRLPCL